jgi:RNA polymerase sigma-70 factor (ECF subfamily)
MRPGEAFVPVSGSKSDHSTVKQELDAQFRASLMSYFLRRVGNRSEAEDLTQETFTRLIGSQSFEGAAETRAYVFRVASNLLRDRARALARKRGMPVLPLETATDEFDAAMAEEIGPERVVMGKEKLGEVLASLDELGARTKSIFILFRLEGMKQKDIAALYGIGLSTVEKHVMSAVLHLANRFGRDR